MERSVLGVPEHVKLVFRVCTLEDGVLIPGPVPHATESDAELMKEHLQGHFPDAEYIVKPALILLH